MNEAVGKMLEKYVCTTEEDRVHALREILQEIALLGLWRSKFFEHAAFYGGTALRIVYGLDRFSEDLDFSLLSPNAEFDIAGYLPALQNEIAAFGFTVEAKMQQKTLATPIQSAFLKANTVNIMLELQEGDSEIMALHPGKLLKIKLEVDTDPPCRFAVESKYLLHPIPFAVRTYALPDLFAGKMHALLCRKWKNRVKGRDWYDFVWYCAHHPRLHMAHLEERMRQSGHWLEKEALDAEKIMLFLNDAIASLDIHQARQDVLPFVKRPDSVEIWSKDFFMSLLPRIMAI